MRQHCNSVWETRTETLYFQFGPMSLFTVKFRSLTLASSPFVLDTDLEIPLDVAAAKSCQAVLVSAMRASKEFATIAFEKGGLRYVIRRAERYIIDLDGSFAAYLKKFSGGTRGRLGRTVKAFARANAGTAELREYRTPTEMKEFRDAAIAISHRSYKQEIGWGFHEDETFARQIELDAADGRARGYVLMHHGNPAAYRLLRIERDVIIDKYTAYDEELARWSPGTVLLYMILERLFEQHEFRLFDFDGLEHFAFKSFFSTGAVCCARVVWFRLTIRNVTLFGAHWMVTTVWRFASALRNRLRPNPPKWISARRLAGLQSG